MTEIIFAWHVHHDILVEPLMETMETHIAYIKQFKPVDEVELRLRLFKPVDGTLPAAVVKAGRARVKTLAAYDRALAAQERALVAHDKALPAHKRALVAYARAWATYERALVAYARAWATYERAWVAYGVALWDNQAAIERLHAEECPNCPWNGHTIFPKGGGEVEVKDGQT